jgi:hypothetical protein
MLYIASIQYWVQSKNNSSGIHSGTLTIIKFFLLIRCTTIYWKIFSRGFRATYIRSSSSVNPWGRHRLSHTVIRWAKGNILWATISFSKQWAISWATLSFSELGAQFFEQRVIATPQRHPLSFSHRLIFQVCWKLIDEILKTSLIKAQT